MPPTIALDIAPTPLEEALELDLSILSQTLQHGFHVHRLARYYRRLTMSSKCIHRNQIPHLGPTTRWMKQQRLKLNYDFERRSRKKKADQWELVPGGDKEVRKNQGESKFELILQWVNYTLIKSLPEAINRLEDASSYLFAEMSRGFYLPFCSVALAAIARIRVILLKFGREAVEECREMVNCVEKMDGVWEKEVVKKWCASLPENYTVRFMEVQKEMDAKVGLERQDSEVISEKDRSSVDEEQSSISDQIDDDIGESIDVTAMTTEIMEEKNKEDMDKNPKIITTKQTTTKSSLVAQDNNPKQMRKKKKTKDTKLQSKGVIEDIFVSSKRSKKDSKDDVSSVPKKKKKEKKSSKKKKKSVLDEIFDKL